MFSRFSSATHTFSFSCSSLEAEWEEHELHQTQAGRPRTISLPGNSYVCPQVPPLSADDTETISCLHTAHCKRNLGSPSSYCQVWASPDFSLHSQEGSLQITNWLILKVNRVLGLIFSHSEGAKHKVVIPLQQASESHLHSARNRFTPKCVLRSPCSALLPRNLASTLRPVNVAIAISSKRTIKYK